MTLSAEDNLRLNVLLSQNLQAVRIDESKMIIYALTDKGEAKIPLNANCKDDKYIKQIKAVLSSQVLGSPGGYPVYLKRWTRMGQAKDKSLSQLLLLGETEAVVAVVHASGLTDELAARAWWAMPTSENARRMLQNKAVANGKTGSVLADFLIEFIPFEEEQINVIESVRLVLQPGLITEEEKKKLWNKCKTKNSYYVGFLHTLPDDLPGEIKSNSAKTSIYEKLTQLSNNKYTLLLKKIMNKKGQLFIETVQIALEKPGNQDVVLSLFKAIEKYFCSVKIIDSSVNDIEELKNIVKNMIENSKDGSEISEVLVACSEIKDKLAAVQLLSFVSEDLVHPIFVKTDSMGTVMRKKIKPITDVIQENLQILLS